MIQWKVIPGGPQYPGPAQCLLPAAAPWPLLQPGGGGRGGGPLSPHQHPQEGQAQEAVQGSSGTCSEQTSTQSLITFVSAYQFYVYLPWIKASLA